jgi:hypothetical protein
MSSATAHEDAMAAIERAAGQVAAARGLPDDEAIVLLWDALPVLERELGAYHPEVGDALADLAGIHRRRGEDSEAAMLLERLEVIRGEAVLQPS